MQKKLDWPVREGEAKKTELRYNADWLSKLSFKDVIDMATNFTVQQFLVRDNFSKRREGAEHLLSVRLSSMPRNKRGDANK